MFAVDAAALAAGTGATLWAAPPNESGGASSGLGLNETAPPLSPLMNDRMNQHDAQERLRTVVLLRIWVWLSHTLRGELFPNGSEESGQSCVIVRVDPSPPDDADFLKEWLQALDTQGFRDECVDELGANRREVNQELSGVLTQ